MDVHHPSLEPMLEPDAGTMPAGRGGRSYGGALVARMLIAAMPSMHRDAAPHSLHATFIRAADPLRRIDYSTVVLRSSRRFTTVRIDALQGAVVATATVSFHSPESSAGHGGELRPWRVDPEKIEPAAGGAIPALDATIRTPFDLRDGRVIRDLGGRPSLGVWMRPRVALSERPGVHAAALVWASDFTLTRIADVDHEDEVGERQAASLDHSIWFHRAIEANQWLRYKVVSPIYRGGLALSTGQFTDLSGNVLATVAQESLLRRV